MAEALQCGGEAIIDAILRSLITYGGAARSASVARSCCFVCYWIMGDAPKVTESQRSEVVPFSGPPLFSSKTRNSVRSRGMVTSHDFRLNLLRILF
jgi:hypothetical protein